VVCVAKTKQNKTKKPRGFLGSLQGCANKSRDEILLFLCLGFSDAICGCCSLGKERRAQSCSQTERWELMAPSLGRGSNSAVPLPTVSLPVAARGGGVLPGESDRAHRPGSSSLQQRRGAAPRSPALARTRAAPAAPPRLR
jgi:hypothetical protein